MNDNPTEPMGGSNKSHLIIGLLLFIVGLLIILVAVSLRSQADDSTSSSTVNNQAPTVDSITLSATSGGSSAASLDMNENSTKTAYVHGAYTDNNGCSEVATGGSFTLVLYRSAVSNGSSCTRNDADCLRSSTTGYTCNYSSLPANTCAGDTDVTANYECSVPVQFFADPTDSGSYSAQNWVALITATDSGSLAGTNSATTEVNTLTALNVGSTISFGALALGATSSEVALTVTNTGNNNALDVQTSGTAMACTVGTITLASEKVKYSSSTGQAFGSMTALTGSAASLRISLTKSVDGGSASNTSTYWRLQLPSSGLSGSCSATVTFTAA